MPASPQEGDAFPDVPPTISTRPEALPLIPGNIPAALTALDRWVAWRYSWDGRDWRKVPLNPATGRPASVTDPTTWGSFQRALSYASRPDADGVGFVLTADDPFVAIDVDHCRDPEGGTLTPFAREILADVRSYAEVSPSGTGVRIFAAGRLPRAGRRSAEIEIYQSGRYLTLTGHHLWGTPATIEDRDDAIEALYDRLFPETPLSPNGSRSVTAGLAGTPPGPVPLPTAPDELVLKHARDRYGARFGRLFAGDLSEYGEDHSAADLAFLSQLARFTRDADQLDRLLRQSGLLREKWTGRQDYRDRTITRALDWGDIPLPSGPRDPTPTVPSRTGRVSLPSPPRSDDLGSHDQSARPQRPRRTGTHERACRGCGVTFMTKDGHGRCAYCETCRATPKSRRGQAATTVLPSPTGGPTGAGWVKTWRRVLARDRRRCRFCGRHADRAAHVTPRSHGGTDQDANLVAACEECYLAGLLVSATDFEAKRAYVRATLNLRTS